MPTTSSIPKTTIKHEWIKKHWVKLLVGTIIAVIVLFLIMQIIGFVSRIVNCSSPICKGIGDGLGAAAHFLDALTQGCEKQADCSTVGTNKDTCLKANGCGWGTAASPSPNPGPSSCVNITGLATGDGGPFKLTCGLFDFALGWLLISSGLLMNLGKFASEAIKNAARLSGKSTKKVMEEAIDKVNEKLPELDPVERANKFFEGPAADEFISKIVKLLSEHTGDKINFDAAEGDNSAQTIIANDSADRRAYTVKELVDILEKNGVKDSDARAEADDINKGVGPPIEAP